MLKIYGADLSSPAIKVRLAANYLKTPYEYIRVKLREGEHRSPEYLAINPYGKVPAIDDDGFKLAESNAICKYLAAKAESPIYPTDLKKRAVVDQWTDFATIHVGINLARLTWNRVFAPVVPGVTVDENSVKTGIDFLGRYLPAAEKQLLNHRHLAFEEFSLADIVLLALLDPAEASGYPLTEYRAITQWRNGLRDQEFYRKVHNNYEETLNAMMAMFKGTSK